MADPETGTIWAGGGDGWRGPAVWRSTDRGRAFEKLTDGLAYLLPYRVVPLMVATGDFQYR